MTYTIPMCNVEALDKKMARLEKKAKCYGVDFSYTKSEPFKSSLYNFTYEDSDRGVYIDAIQVDVQCQVKHNGWHVVGLLKNLSGGPDNLVYPMYDNAVVPERFRKSGCYCEHCRIDRRRNETVVLFNEDNEEYVQVGKSCLMEYTRGISADAIASCMASLEAPKGFMEGGSYKPYYPVKSVLEWAYAVMSVDGYKSRTYIEKAFEAMGEKAWKKLDEWQKLPTSRIVGVLLREDDAIEPWKEKEYIDYKEEHKVEGEKFVEDALSWISEKEANSDFEWNLKTLCEQDYIENSGLGTLCYLVNSYQKHLYAMEAEKIKKANMPVTEFFGEVGQRITVNGVLEYCSSFEGFYGTTYIYKMVTNGAEFVWFTSKGLGPEELDHEVKMTGTIKEHKEFRGTKQTVLTRCKVA